MLVCPVVRELPKAEPDHTQLSALNDLFFAVRASRIDLVRHLLLTKRVNAKLSLQKVSILTLSVERNCMEIVRLLLGQGVDVNRYCEIAPGCLETPLFTAVKLGNTDIVQLLLDHGANPNLADSDNRTPLYMAVRCNREVELTALIRAGANLNTADKSGVSPLQIASRGFGKEMLLLILVNHGAYIHQTDFKGRSAIDLAAATNNSTALDLLLDAGARPGKALQERMALVRAKQVDYRDICAEKSIGAARSMLSLERVARKAIRDQLIDAEKSRKQGRSIWNGIERLPIPEHSKIDAKFFVEFDSPSSESDMD